MSRILQELKRRKVFRVAAVYGVVAWLLTQVSDVVLPTFGAPVWVNQTFIFLFIVGFPIALVLAWAYDSTPEGIKPQALVQAAPGLPATSAQPINYIILGIVLLVAGFQVTDRFLGRTQSTPAPRVSASTNDLPPLRASLALGDTVRRGGSNSRAHLALSPDGRWLAFTAQLTDRSGLLLRDLSTGETRYLIEADPLVSDYPYSPVFSPSGEQILFRVLGSSELSVIPRTGGRALELGASTRSTLVAAGIGRADWLSEERIVFTNSEGTLEQLDIATGESASLEVPAIAGEVQLHPHRMGDSPWLLYTVSIGDDFDSARIDAFNLDSGEVRILVASGYNGRYTPSGHLVYARDNGLWAVTLDLEQMQVGGRERLIEDRVEANSSVGYAVYALSNNGRLVYLEGGELATLPSIGVWALSTLAGEQQHLNLPANTFHPVFSPDGEQVAVTVSAAEVTADNYITGYIALYHMADQTLTRRTFSGAAFRPRWSPDGTQLVYGMNLDNQWGLWTQNADGSGQPQLLLSASEPVWPDAFTPDGSALVYGIGGNDAPRLNLLSLVPSETPDRPLLELGTVQVGASISPDGRFIAYSSDENSGAIADRDIIVRPFPNVNDGIWQLSSGDTANASWLPGGTDLVYWAVDGDIYQVAANPANGFRQSTPTRIIDSTYPRSARVLIPGFAISPDGQRILYRNMGGVDSEGATTTYAVVADNWFEKLRQVSP